MILSIPHIWEKNFHIISSKIGYILNLKVLCQILLIFTLFFMNSWARGKHSWLWIQSSCAQILLIPFFIGKNIGITEIWNHGLSNPQTKETDIYRQKEIVCQSTWRETWWPLPMGNRVKRMENGNKGDR